MPTVTNGNKEISMSDYNLIAFVRLYGHRVELSLDERGGIVGTTILTPDVQDLLNAYALGSACVDLRKFNQIRAGVGTEVKQVLRGAK